MIEIINGLEFTNSYSPKEWELREESFRNGGKKFLAYWGEQQDCRRCCLPVVNGYDQDKPSKVITTKKGGLLLVNCSKEQDEKILLVWIMGGFRGVANKYGLVKDMDIVWVGDGRDKHCAPNYPIIFRVTGENPAALMGINGRYHMNDAILIKPGLKQKLIREENIPDTIEELCMNPDNTGYLHFVSGFFPTVRESGVKSLISSEDKIIRV